MKETALGEHGRGLNINEQVSARTRQQVERQGSQGNIWKKRIGGKEPISELGSARQPLQANIPKKEDEAHAKDVGKQPLSRKVGKSRYTGYDIRA